MIRSFGSVTKEFDEWTEKLGIKNNVEVIQKAELLGTARIMRKCWRCKEEIILLEFGHFL